MKKVVIGLAVLVVLGGGLALLTIAAAGIVYYASVDAPEEEIVTLEQVLERPEEAQPDAEGTEEAEDSSEATPEPVPEPQAVAPTPRSAPAPRPRPRASPAPSPAPEPEPEPEPAVDDLPEDDAESLDRVLEDFVIEDLDSEPESKRRRRN